MKTAIIAGLLLVITAAAIVAQPALNTKRLDPFVDPSSGGNHDVPVSAGKIDVVFVLDTTGSMGGLIDTAKQKIWSIASSMASAQNSPEIRVGLVAYRDRGDAYVTQVTDLSHDLDTVYAKLMDFRAEGGGDTPESGHTALRVAIDQLDWSQDDGVYKTIFLVGDAPAHTDYQDEEQLPAIVARAVQKGIMVNTIRCGDRVDTAQQWRQIAQLAQGDFISVGQNVAAVSITTPYDSRLAEASAAMDETRLPFGGAEAMADAAVKAEATAKLHEKASPATLARRAAFNAKAGAARNRYGEHDLVEAVVSGRVKLEEVEAEQLPEILRDLPLEQQYAQVQAVHEKRRQLAEEISELSSQRAEYMEDKVAALDDVDESFEYKVYETVKAQAAKKGMSFSDDKATPEL